MTGALASWPAAARVGPDAGRVPALSVVIPARAEGGRIAGTLDLLLESVRTPCEVLVVVDSAGDPTADAVRAYAVTERRVRLLLNGYGRGPAAAIRFGMDAAAAPVLVVTMADGSDDPCQVDELAALVRGGAVVAAASRYARGGRQLGGPLVKGMLSRLAGTSLRLLARAGTSDATNSFKAYSADFVAMAGVESRHGFEIGIELTAKARRLRLPVAEIPTTWRDRAGGRSSFRLARWLPRYLRWYLFCFGPARRQASPAGQILPGGAAGD